MTQKEKQSDEGILPIYLTVDQKLREISLSHAVAKSYNADVIKNANKYYEFLASKETRGETKTLKGVIATLREEFPKMNHLDLMELLPKLIKIQLSFS